MGAFISLTLSRFAFCPYLKLSGKLRSGVIGMRECGFNFYVLAAGSVTETLSLWAKIEWNNRP